MALIAPSHSKRKTTEVKLNFRIFTSIKNQKNEHHRTESDFGSRKRSQT